MSHADHNLIIEVTDAFGTSDLNLMHIIGGQRANFEAAAEATGFGKFNILLLIVALPAGTASILVTTTMAYVFPIAECDLDLSLENKGRLNAVTYLGMITSGFFWGYLSDTLGRRRSCMVGYLLNGLCVALSGLSQQYAMLLVLKFCEGFIINGPFAALFTYLNEFHCAKYRSLLPSISGIIYSIANLLLPMLGWLILTKPIHISIFGDFIVLRSWNIFLLVCPIPSLTAGIAFIFLPESPKFQMSHGKNQLAYKTFQTMYAWNSGNSPQNYPITSLAYEANYSVSRDDISRHKSKVQAFKDGWQQLMPLFHHPYRSKMLLAAATNALLMMALNTLRLWLPQIFAAISNYQASHQIGNKSPNLCTMLGTLRLNTTVKNEDCVMNYQLDSAYINNIIVALVSMVCWFITAPVTRKIGKQRIMEAYTSAIGGIFGICIYFAHNETDTVALSSLSIALIGVSTTTLLSIVVDIFPTTLRTMTVALTMVCGRCGSSTGNLIFPDLLSAGCFPPFATLGCLAIGGAILSTALPKTDTKPLE